MDKINFSTEFIAIESDNPPGTSQMIFEEFQLVAIVDILDSALSPRVVYSSNQLEMAEETIRYQREHIEKALQIIKGRFPGFD